VIQLDRALPHMVLDAVQNDRKILGQRVSNLPARFDLAQRLSREGDFDRYFTLYAPADYERDALYVFTPDLMALLIDEAGSGEGGSMDVEIIDDRMYVYAPGSGTSFSHSSGSGSPRSCKPWERRLSVRPPTMRTSALATEP
jgi:hypothetical protein